MRFEGFIGQTYTGLGLAPDAERLKNWYPETAAVGSHPKAPIWYYPTPGLRLFTNCSAAVGPVRAMIDTNDRCFAIVGERLYEIFEDGTNNDCGYVTPNGIASMASNGKQLFIASDQQGFVFDLAGKDGLVGIATDQFSGAAMAACVDGYFIALNPNSRRAQSSSLYDGLVWDALDFGLAEGSADNLISMFADHRELWFFGKKRVEVFSNTGADGFPFERNPGAYIETGIAAAASVAKLDNTIFWLGADERGSGIVWKAAGYQPVRVSTHAIEWHIEKYKESGKRIDDAIGWTYQQGGHTFYVLTFPSADATWVLDEATGLWHERTWLDTQRGRESAHLGRCHSFSFGKHLVGSRVDGKIYEMRTDVYDDDGNPIRRVRTSPHLAEEQKWFIYSLLQLEMDFGVGLQLGQGSDPQIMLRCSDDGGKTWGNERRAGLGKSGESEYTQAQWRSLGRSRRRAFEVSMTDPVFACLVDAYLNVTPGY